VKKVAVGVDGDRCVSQRPGRLTAVDRSGCMVGSPPRKITLADGCRRAKDRQPAVDGIDIQSMAAVLVGIDVAVAAAQIAPGQEVEEDIGRMAGEGYGSTHHIDFMKFSRSASSSLSEDDGHPAQAPHLFFGPDQLFVGQRRR
jgi:hypothetical protein